jgi:hypothetical protein
MMSRGGGVTGRERLDAILHRRNADRLSWTTLADAATVDHLPESLRGGGGLALYRHLGCDTLLLNGWGTPHAFGNPALVLPEGVRTEQWTEGDVEIRETRTPAGTLRATFRSHHPVKPPVTSGADVRVFLDLWEGSRYEYRDDGPSHAALSEAIGEAGLAVAYWGPSTIPRLLEYDMGSEAFYYLLQDEPELMERLIRVMHEREMRAFEHLARGPFETVVLCENTSTYFIGPEIYRRYNAPHVRDFVDVMHRGGKIALVHMCGHVRNLLDQFGDTGLDGIHALTPPPTGDTPCELALDALGEEKVIVGILDPSIFLSGPVEEIGPALDALYTPRMRRAHFALWAAADGIRVPLERFEAVAAWMDRNARR